MSLLALISLLAIMLTLAAIPSASVALVVTRSATFGFSNGVATAAGIVLGDLVFIALTLLGMSFLAETMGSFFVVLRYLGGAYLLWLGFNLLRAKTKVQVQKEDARRLSLCASCLAGFVLTLGDAKAILFYASLLPNFVDVTSLTAADITVLALVTVLAVGGTKVLYALAARRIVNSFQSAKAQRWTRSTAGGVMIGTGTYLMVKS